MARSKQERMLRGLGAKYGRTVRKRYTRVVVTLRQKRKCPRCGAWRLRRVVVGIWKCRACGHELAGGAYDVEG